jgi:hypothetical protein
MADGHPVAVGVGDLRRRMDEIAVVMDDPAPAEDLAPVRKDGPEEADALIDDANAPAGRAQSQSRTGEATDREAENHAGCHPPGVSAEPLAGPKRADDTAFRNVDETYPDKFPDGDLR